MSISRRRVLANECARVSGVSELPLPSNVRFHYVMLDFARKVRAAESVAEQDRLIDEFKDTVQKVLLESEQWINEKELVQRYKAFIPTVNVARNKRQRKNGPPFIKCGDFRKSRVLYKVADVEKWILELEEVSKGLDLSVQKEGETL